MNHVRNNLKKIQIVLVLLIIGVLALVVWRLNAGVQVPAVQSADDLTKLEQQLNATPIDNLEGELHSATSF